MRKKTLFLVLLLSVAIALPAGAKTLKFAFQGSLDSIDPYYLNETFHLGTQGNVFEGLIRRGPNLEIEPALAERWEVMEPTRWRFYLRKGVKFHDGTPFTADDVVFSATRVRHPDSDLRVRISADTKVVKVDDHTVDFITDAPNPILPNEWSTWYIMSKSWTEKHDAVMPQSATKKEENYATRHANGTGPFILVSHEPGVKTVCKVNPDWWDNPNKIHNVTEVIFTQISNDATRVAALLSGQVDMAYPIPVQDMKRVDDNAATRMMVGPELRTIFLGMDQFRDELLYSNVKGKNPFKDKRVRQAFYQAIDIEAIKKKVMRGLSEPSAMMVAPGVHGGGNPKFKRLEYDPEASKKLLTEAGYPDGFEVGMDCPNDRYVNDEQICLATVSMLAKVGIKVNLLAQPKAKYFAKILAPKRDTSFYLLGWTPSSFDSYNPLNFLHHCPKDTGEGKFNLGGYCNPEVDKLTAMVNSETDQAKRDALIEQAWTMTIDDIAHIPLHQQALAWGVNNKVQLKQRPDNEFKWRHVVIE
ncbi:MAG: ABC transporter substrate-binding protein [Desulfobacterales bacterium]|jgi:peptide/nickel transport system substrate-binding protein